MKPGQVSLSHRSVLQPWSIAPRQAPYAPHDALLSALQYLTQQVVFLSASLTRLYTLKDRKCVFLALQILLCEIVLWHILLIICWMSSGKPNHSFSPFILVRLFYSGNSMRLGELFLASLLDHNGLKYLMVNIHKHIHKYILFFYTFQF